MRLSRLCLVGALALAATACDDDNGTAPEMGPIAGLRFVNAVPDTSGQDMRIIDRTWDAFLGVNFRNAYPGAAYLAVPAGARDLRVFLSASSGGGRDPNAVSTVMADLPGQSLTEGSNYTLLHLGFRRGGTPAAEVRLIADDYGAAPGAGSFKIRIFHVAATSPAIGAVDVYARASSADPLPTTPLVSNLAFGASSDYIELPVGTLDLAVTAAGSTTVLFSGTAPAGAPPTTVASGIAGSTAEGSVLTVFLMPGAVPGSEAQTLDASSNCTNCSPALLYLADRRPPILDE
jgi:hypothetical protein